MFSDLFSFFFPLLDLRAISEFLGQLAFFCEDREYRGRVGNNIHDSRTGLKLLED